MDLMISITVNSAGAESDIKKISDETKKAGDESDRSVSRFTKLGTAMSAAAKVGAAAFVTASTAVVAIGKKALDAYADYEQLAGGAELLWGEAYDFIADKAANAYKTVQMSQNEYLTQVNGFSTGLKTALGGNAQQAAELASKIVTAEADIVAATGASQESIQNAFNGIMKSNFTMLDNLQLGITPTKEGFQQVIDKVNEWNAANGEATQYQIDNLADCQAALVDYVEMQGLAGYAANEASQTIQGSLASLKGAWDNLLVSFGDENGDVGAAFEAVANSATDAIGNIAPRVITILGSMGTLLQEKGPEIVQFLIDGIVQYAPKVAEVAGSLIVSLVTGLISNLPKIVVGAGKIVVALVNAIFNSLGQLLLVGGQALDKFVAGIQKKLGGAAEAGKSILTKVGEGIAALFGDIVSKGAEIIENVKSGVNQKIEDAKTWGADLISNFISGITSKIGALVESVSGVASTIRSYLHFTEPDEGPLSDFHTYAPDMVKLFAEGIRAHKKEAKDAAWELADAVSNVLGNALNTSGMMKTMFGNVYELWAKSYDIDNAELHAAEGTLNELESMLKAQDRIVSEAEKTRQQAIKAQEAVVEAARKASDADIWNDSKLKAYKEAKELLSALQGSATNENASKYANSELYQTVVNLKQEKELREMINEEISKQNELISGIREGDDTTKAKAQLQALTKQYEEQNKSVAAADEAYKEIIKKYGEGSTKATEFRNSLAEQKAQLLDITAQYNALTDQINRYNQAMSVASSYGSSDYTSRVSFAQSGLGTSTSALINSNSATEQNVNLSADIYMDTAKVGEALYKPIINTFKNNGTTLQFGY